MSFPFLAFLHLQRMNLNCLWAVKLTSILTPSHCHFMMTPSWSCSRALSCVSHPYRPAAASGTCPRYWLLGVGAMFCGNFWGHHLQPINRSHQTESPVFFLFNKLIFSLNTVLPCFASDSASGPLLCLDMCWLNPWCSIVPEASPISSSYSLRDVSGGRVFWLYRFQGVQNLEVKSENGTGRLIIWLPC